MTYICELVSSIVCINLIMLWANNKHASYVPIIFATFLALLFIAMFMTVLLMRNRIQMALALVKESSR